MYSKWCTGLWAAEAKINNNNTFYYCSIARLASSLLHSWFFYYNNKNKTSTYHRSVFLLSTQFLHLLKTEKLQSFTMGQFYSFLRDWFDVNQLLEAGRNTVVQQRLALIVILTNNCSHLSC